MSNESTKFPVWCDLSCPHASFPNEEAVDGSGSCRTFLALYCRHLEELVTKNAPCRARIQAKGAE